MSLQQQLDPLSRNLLFTMGRALMALAEGHVDVPVGPRVSRVGLHADTPRRAMGPRRTYRLRAISAKKLSTLTPAARLVVEALTAKANQSSPDLAEATQLSRKTVENILSSLNLMKALVRTKVLARAADAEARHA